jgi:hypothetical protein
MCLLTVSMRILVLLLVFGVRACRGGESVAVLAGLSTELGEFFKKEDVEW